LLATFKNLQADLKRQQEHLVPLDEEIQALEKRLAGYPETYTFKQKIVEQDLLDEEGHDEV
jgi:hypothetical protein